MVNKGNERSVEIMTLKNAAADCCITLFLYFSSKWPKIELSKKYVKCPRRVYGENSPTIVVQHT